MDHLIPTAQDMLSRSDSERIACIYSSRWIGYTRAKEIIARMDMLFTRPRIARMPGLLIVSPTANGKSRLLERFVALHPRVDDPAKARLELPVLMIECPPGPDERRFYHALLEELNVPYTYSSRIEQKHKQVKAVLEKVGTKLLILDEFHNIVAGPRNRQLLFLNMVKYVSNDLRLPIVAAGTPVAHDAVSLIPELASRFSPVDLPLWHDRDEFIMLLDAFEKMLPLKRRSNLRAESIANELTVLSEFILGELATILSDAACVAIKSGEERITRQIIKGLKHVPLSRRRRVTGLYSEERPSDTELFDADQLSETP